MKRAMLIFAMVATVTVAGVKPKPAEADSEILPADIDVDRIVLDILKGKHFDFNVVTSVLDARVRETMRGAPTFTLTIHDPDYELIDSDVLFETDKDGDRELRTIDVELANDRWYRLVKLSFAPATSGRGLDLVLTFEHRTVAYLRQHNKPLRARRSKMTRAEFVIRFAREVKAEKIHFVTLGELHKEQPIGHRKRKDKKQRDKDRDPGFVDGASIEVKRVRATAGQRRNIEEVLMEGDSMGAREKVLVSAVMCITQESSALTSATNGVHVGLFQQDPAGWPATRDPSTDSHAFFAQAIKIDRAQPNLSEAELIEKVQRSGQGSLYAQWEGEARHTVRAFRGTGGESRVRTKPYVFARGSKGKREDSWTAANRLADEVNWRCFVTGKRTWFFVKETDLFKSRPRIKIGRDAPGVFSVSGDLDKGKRVRTLTLTVRIKLWTAPPGSVVIVEGYGPADGRWLVEDIERSLFASEAEVTLGKPTKPKPEPKPETRSTSSSGSDDASGKGKAAKLYQICKRFNGPYVYGGGHGPPLDQLSYSSGMDCSSSVSKALFEAGLFGHDVALVSGALAAQYGEPGEGRVFTVWAHSGHVFIEFHGLGSGKRFDTSPQGDGGSGPRLRNTTRSHGGFTPRHWPGL